MFTARRWMAKQEDRGHSDRMFRALHRPMQLESKQDAHLLAHKGAEKGVYCMTVSS